MSGRIEVFPSVPETSVTRSVIGRRGVHVHEREIAAVGGVFAQAEHV